MRNIVLAVLFLFSSTYVCAADFSAGKELYESLGCAGCHGDKSGSRLADYPSLVGSNSKTISSELNKYRSGVRVDPTMTAMAEGLSDKDIEDLAEYIVNR